MNIRTQKQSQSKNGAESHSHQWLRGRDDLHQAERSPHQGVGGEGKKDSRVGGEEQGVEEDD